MTFELPIRYGLNEQIGGHARSAARMLEAAQHSRCYSLRTLRVW
jgi:hypothetical protein